MTNTQDMTHNEFQAWFVRYIAEECDTLYWVDLRSNDAAFKQVRDAVRRLQFDPSPIREITVNLPFIESYRLGPIHLTLTLGMDSSKRVSLMFEAEDPLFCEVERMSAP